MAQKAITEINNDFLEKYMASAPTAYVLTYICAQKFIQEGRVNYTADELAKSLGMTESDVKKALEFWKSKGEFLSTKIPQAAPNYSEEEMRFYVDNNEDFKGLISSAEMHMGKLLSPSEVTMLYSFHDWYRLPLEVIELLLAYCCNNGHTSIKYIEKVAIAWDDAGVHDRQSALDYINSYNDVYMKVMRGLGMGNKNPVGKQTEYIKKWTENMPVDLVLYACEKAAMIVSNGNPFPYTDKIISNWQKDGINTLQKAKSADEEFAKKKGFVPQVNTKQPVEKVRKTKFTNYEEHEWDYDELSRIKFAELTKGLGGADSGN